MRIEDVIGGWITRTREESGQTQQEIGDELGKILGRPWSRQAVSAAEKGRRAFTAAELVALSYVLQVGVEALLEPPPGVAAIELADGPALDVRAWRGQSTETVDTSLRALLDALNETKDAWSDLSSAATRIDDLQLKAAMAALAAARARGFSAVPNLLDMPARDPR